MNKLFIAAVVAFVVPNIAGAEHKDVVISAMHSTVVKDNFGGCVRTKWTVDSDKCGKIMHHKPVKGKKYHVATVYFDFDKYNLRNDAYATVKGVYNELKSDGMDPTIHVDGHTDEVGTAAYNNKLSLKRAVEVKKELEHLGVPGMHIKAEGHGFHKPAVSSPAGKREQKNRRVEISYSTSK